MRAACFLFLLFLLRVKAVHCSISLIFENYRSDHHDPVHHIKLLGLAVREDLQLTIWLYRTCVIIVITTII